MKTGPNFFKRVLYFILALYFLWGAFGSTIINLLAPAQELTYVQVIQLIDEKQVKSIEVFTNNLTAEIYLKEDEQRYVTTILDENVFYEYIQENITSEDDLKITRSQKSVWLKILSFFFGIFFASNAFQKKNSKKKSASIKISTNDPIMNFESKPKSTINQTSEKEKILFSDVAGLKETKEELMEVVDFLKNPSKYVEMGAKIPKGILLAGPPGTGKTLLAKAIANEAGINSFIASGAEFDEMYVGVGASRVRELFNSAKKYAPSLIFIDEIDAVGQKRTNLDTSGHNQTIEQLLTEMDGFDTESNVIVLAATNRPESLDSALVRPGRFDRTIEIYLPDVDERVEILKVHGKNKKFMDNVSFEKIAHNTAGFSGAELENILNEAALIAVRKNERAISQESIDEALKKVSIGLQKKGKKISEKERKLTAYHEAGHAIVGKFLPTQANVKEVSIIPRGSAGGYTLHETVEDKYYTSKTELTERLVVLLGGRAAEQIALNDISTGASSDLRSATEIAKNMICVYGMNQEVGPISLVDTHSELLGPETTSLIGKLITQSVKEAEKRAIQLLDENKKLLEMVTNALLEKETISGSELDEIFETYQNSRTNNV